MGYLTRMACTLAVFASPAAAYEVLFLGTPYQNANGSSGQVVTALMDYEKTTDGATGLIDHTDLQSGFTALFSVNCHQASVYLVAAPATEQPQPPQGSGLTVQIFPEGAEITFGDGQVGSIDLTSNQSPNSRVKLAANLGETQYQTYLAKHRTQKSMSPQDVATGETAFIIARHPQLVAMLAMALVARACSPMQ